MIKTIGICAGAAFRARKNKGKQVPPWKHLLYYSYPPLSISSITSRSKIQPDKCRKLLLKVHIKSRQDPMNKSIYNLLFKTRVLLLDKLKEYDKK